MHRDRHSPSTRVAVLVPCFDEAQTVGDVVASFRDELPVADIWVFDNNSTDDTAKQAAAAGATVIQVSRRGKGNVVREMFRLVEADLYVLVDGDSTYPAAEVHQLLHPVQCGQADMSVGDRHSSEAYDLENTRRFHGFGNRLVRWLINTLFRSELKDIMSGYRVFSRYFVKTFPVLSEGFEIETEMTLHALDKRFRIVEIPIGFKERKAGSVSKLNTYADGIRILRTIAMIFKNYRPMIFFGVCSIICVLLGLIIGAFPIIEYIRYSYVYKVPSAILASALEILAMLLFSCGVILDTIVRQHREFYELYLNNYPEQESFRHAP